MLSEFNVLAQSPMLDAVGPEFISNFIELQAALVPQITGIGWRPVYGHWEAEIIGGREFRKLGG